MPVKASYNNCHHSRSHLALGDTIGKYIKMLLLTLVTVSCFWYGRNWVCWDVALCVWLGSSMSCTRYKSTANSAYVCLMQSLFADWDHMATAVVRRASLDKAALVTVFVGAWLVPACFLCLFVFARYTEHKHRSIAYASGMWWQSLHWDVSVIGELLKSNRNSARFPSLASLI